MHHKAWNPESSVLSILPQLSHNCPTYCIVGNFRWVQIFKIFADRPTSMKIRTAKKWTEMEIDDVITCIRRVPMWTRWFSTVCLPSKWSLWRISLLLHKNTNKPVRDGPRMSHQLVGVWSEHPAFCENRSQDAFPWKFAPAKISRYMVFT